MNSLHSALAAAVAALEELKSAPMPWALVGGLAVSARAEPRFTRDADLVVSVASDPEAERLVFAMRSKGFGVVATVEHETARRLATVRFSAPPEGSGVIVDLSFASSGIEAEVARDADLLEIVPGLKVPVASVGHLLALKVLARDDQRRPQDALDLKSLLSVADDVELARARSSLELIQSRGFGRDKNLLADWQALIRSPR